MVVGKLQSFVKNNKLSMQKPMPVCLYNKFKPEKGFQVAMHLGKILGRQA